MAREPAGRYASAQELEMAGSLAHAAEDLLRTTPRLTDDSRRTLEKSLEKSVAVLDEIRRRAPRDPETRKHAAVAYARLGRIRHMLLQWPEAERAFRTTAAMYEELAAEFPSDRGYRYSVFHLHHLLALMVTEDPEEFERLSRYALRTLEGLHQEDVAEPVYREALMTQYASLGSYLVSSHRFREAEVLFQKGIRVGEQLHQDFPNRPEYLKSWAYNLWGRGEVLAETGHTRQALAYFRQALEGLRRCAREIPAERSYRAEANRWAFRLAEALLDAEEYGEAETLLKELLPLLTTERDAYAQDPRLCRPVPATHALLSRVYQATGRPAEGALRLALELLHGLPNEHAESTGIHGDIARHLAHGPCEGLRDLERALAHARWAGDFGLLGVVHFLRGEWPEGVAALRRDLAAPAPRNLGHRFVLAMALHRSGDAAAAHREYDETRAYLKRTGVDTPDLRRRQAEAKSVLGVKE